MTYNRKTVVGKTGSLNRTEMMNGRRNTYHLRERLMAERSFEGFSDREILSTILSHAKSPVNPESMAVRLLDSFGSLKAVLEARPEQLMAIKGMNDTTAGLIAIAVPLMRAWIRSTGGKNVAILNSTAAKTYCRSLLVGERVEKFYVVALNSRFHVLGKRLISTGSLMEVSAYPRLVVETALNYNAKCILLCHNHPGGTCAASSEDIASTVNLQNILQRLDIVLLDHIIVAGNDTYSMWEQHDFSPEARNNVPVTGNRKGMSPETRRKNTACYRSKDKEVKSMPYNRKAFGIAVSKMRVQKEMTQEQLSGLAGIARSHLAALESGEKVVKLDTLWRIAEALGLKPGELVMLTESECLKNNCTRK